MWFAFFLIAIFQGLSGWNDGGNLLGLFEHAGTKTRKSLTLLVIGIAVGPFILGSHVAKTVGQEIILLHHGDIHVLNEALLATLATLVLTWLVRLPTSTSLALIGGLIGATIESIGIRAIHWHGFWMTIFSVLLSVVFGFLAGAISYRIERHYRHRVTRPLDPLWRRLSYILSFIQGVAYGANDAEKAIGLAALLLLLAHQTGHFTITPLLVGGSTAIWLVGCLLGGQRIARTIGEAFYKLKPKHVVAIQSSAALVVITAATLGGPVSTTQTSDSALFGVGRDLHHQRLEIKKVVRLFIAWGLTLPVAVIFGLFAAWITHLH
ncbi:inorganic phosphate transporter [Sulfoacidibacillus thermotolerans]|uniref:Inorganic phosphate transporter n=1 Tax=Sulfoacidibacillus thermotolerans TaxID=1765684 RepID=A0A2U3D6F4_SULT2|nr:inorganic phosphate transporter [Sulfoacidibacillus thermotolerans]PWI56862.1 hypothetical protein BM613_11535 [Sulfoacidibacillus thermotolerans]